MVVNIQAVGETYKQRFEEHMGKQEWTDYIYERELIEYIYGK